VPLTRLLCLRFAAQAPVLSDPFLFRNVPLPKGCVFHVSPLMHAPRQAPPKYFLRSRSNSFFPRPQSRASSPSVGTILFRFSFLWFPMYLTCLSTPVCVFLLFHCSWVRMTDSLLSLPPNPVVTLRGCTARDRPIFSGLNTPISWFSFLQLIPSSRPAEGRDFPWWTPLSPLL